MVQDRKILQNQAKKLREKGKSYSQISKDLKIPKSTLSNWFSSLQWSIKVKNRLSKIQAGTKSNLLSANLERQRRREIRHRNYISEAADNYDSLKKDPLFLIGISLYWGEGEKTDSGRVSVINTDPGMVLVMANFYRKCLKISQGDLRAGLFIYEDIDQKAALDFWSMYLNIPPSQFIKTQILKSRTKHTKNRSKYGICSLYFSNTELSIKIREWIRLMGQDITRQVEPSTLSGISLPVKHYLAKVE